MEILIVIQKRQHLTRTIEGRFHGTSVQPVVVQKNRSVRVGIRINVNIYIKKLSTNIGGVNQLIKDTKRVSEVLPIALGLLKEGAGTYYSFWVSKQAEYDEPEINQTRLNFRVEFRLDNTIT